MTSRGFFLFCLQKQSVFAGAAALIYVTLGKPSADLCQMAQTETF